MRYLALTGLLAACSPSGEDGACKDNLLPGDLVITEVFADFKPPPGGSGEDAGKEWLEIYNASDRPVTLEGLSVVHSKVDDSDPDVHVMSSITIAPGQFFTLGNATSDLIPPYVDYGYADELGGLYNSAGKIALRCGDSEIDSAVYDDVKSGKSRQLTGAQPPDYTLNDDQVNWCDGAGSEFETGNFGTPGQDNDCNPVIIGQCNDAGTMRDVVSPAAGNLVITELMPNPIGSGDVDVNKEWFEVRVMADVDLNGLEIDRLNTATAPDVIASADCLHVTTGDTVLFARTTESAMNGMLPPDAVVATFSKTSLVQTAGDLQILANGAQIDAITWTGAREGKSISLDPDLVDASSNDSPGNFCDGVGAYDTDGDMGSPGADNGQCTILPPMGMCDDNGTIRPVVKPLPNALVINEFLTNAAGTGSPSPDQTQEWIELVNTSAAPFDLNGLTVMATSTSSLINPPECKSIAPGAYALLAHNADPATNGGLVGVDATFPSSMNLGSQISVLDGMTILDAVTGISGTDGVTDQLKPANQNTTDNDSLANFCKAQKVAAQKYGPLENYGTPKALNVCP